MTTEGENDIPLGKDTPLTSAPTEMGTGMQSLAMAEGKICPKCLVKAHVQVRAAIQHIIK